MYGLWELWELWGLWNLRDSRHLWDMRCARDLRHPQGGWAGAGKKGR